MVDVGGCCKLKAIFGKKLIMEFSEVDGCLLFHLLVSRNVFFLFIKSFLEDCNLTRCRMCEAPSAGACWLCGP